jgi:hypothetical protein
VGRQSRLDSWALACELLLIVAAREYLWLIVPAELQGMASKGLGAALVLVLLSVVWRHAPRSRALLGILAIAAWHSLQTLICSAAYMLEPWPTVPGVGICSSRIGFDLGALGLLAVAVVAYRLIPVRLDSIEDGK